MAATAFCNISNGYRITKISQQNRIPALRKHSFVSTRQVEQTTFSSYKWTQKCLDKTLKCKAVLASAPAPAPVDEEVVGKIEEKEGGKVEELSRETLIWRAIKLPMYTVALIPVTVGSAAAYWQTGQFSMLRYLMVLACYIIVNIWVNLSNDVYDFDTGADKNKKESVINLFGSRTLINVLAWSALVLGSLGLTSVAVLAGNPRSIVLLASAIFCFFLYQCPPFRLSYYGVGEPLLFLAYGPLSTIAFYLLHSRTSELAISSVVVWSSVLVGLTTSLILFCSHFHQIEDDKAVGKISPLVRLGTEAGSNVVKASVIGLYALVLALGFTGTLPLASVVLSCMTLPMGNAIVNFVQKNHKDKSKIFMGKYFCVRLHSAFGGALAAGLVAARLFAKQQLPQALGI
ncbi:UbiA prenyltransferase family protein [Perilla frutescens var. hirtella]|uniref:UbiA prenyltransferase family protein n=1 Tax=Perilla frutescens var. hirtella TaxID=608512 RepID=A0AAD4JH97_PERFH|nr:UbiA prenyltransferase family protein [Perilla frutescens var. hirtella]